MADQLGLSTVAEGVETAEPLPVSRLEELMRRGGEALQPCALGAAAERC